MGKPPSFVYLNRIMEEKLPEKVEIHFTDRYDALGIPHPDPKTMCRGHCEGTGWVPVYKKEGDSRYGEEGHCHCIEEGEEDERLTNRWHEAEEKSPTDDGWHFVVCPDCEGSGVRYGVVTGEEQECPEESHDFVVDLDSKPVPSRKVTKTRSVNAVGVGLDNIPGAEVYADDDSSTEVIDAMAKVLQGV